MTERIMNSPFDRQLPVYSPITARSIAAGLRATVRSSTRASALEDLAARVAARWRPDSVILTDSGTSALRVAIEAAMRYTGRTAVALPAFGCYDMITAALGATARIILYDVDETSLGPYADSLDEVLSRDVAAVVGAHLYGVPIDIDDLKARAKRVGSLVIEDAAQGSGGAIRDRPLGALGALSVLSFGRGKGRTGGSGGALLLHTAEETAKLTSIIEAILEPGNLEIDAIGRVLGQWLFGRPSLYGLPAAIPQLGLGTTHYRLPWPPREIGPCPAAALLANWQVSDREEVARRTNGERLTIAVKALEDLGFVTPQPKASMAVSGYLRFPMLAPSGSIPTIYERHLNELGIMRSYPTTLQELAGTDQSIPGYRGAERLSRRLWTLPTHSRLRHPWHGIQAIQEAFSHSA